MKQNLLNVFKCKFWVVVHQQQPCPVKNHGHSYPRMLHMGRFSSVTWPWSTWGRRGSCSSCQPTAGRGPKLARPEFVGISSGYWVISTFCFCGSYELLRTKLNLLVIPVALLRDQRRRTSWWHRSRPVWKNRSRPVWKICIWSISTLSLSPQEVFPLRNSAF